MGPPASSYRVLDRGRWPRPPGHERRHLGSIRRHSRPFPSGARRTGDGRVAAALSILVLFPAALLITALEGGRPAVRELFARMLRWRVGIRWWLFALLALPATTLLVAVLFGDSAHLPGPEVLVGELLGLAAGLFLINIWEEATWAGFFQTHLERRHNFFVAAALTGLPFTAVHMPLQVINGRSRRPLTWSWPSLCSSS